MFTLYDSYINISYSPKRRQHCDRIEAEFWAQSRIPKVSIRKFWRSSIYLSYVILCLLFTFSWSLWMNYERNLFLNEFWIWGSQGESLLRWLETVSSTIVLWWVVTSTLYHLMLQTWYQNNCPTIGEHVVIFVTQKVTIATVLLAKNTFN